MRQRRKRDETLEGREGGVSQEGKERGELKTRGDPVFTQAQSTLSYQR